MSTHTIRVHFGDCDPAGIAFYPNMFRWFDATYHELLRQLDLDHRTLQRSLEILGTGVMEANARFFSPLVPDSEVAIHATLTEWKSHSFKVAYTGTCNGRKVFEGFEIRGLFRVVDGRVRAGDVEPLRKLLEQALARLEAEGAAEE